MKSIWEGEMKHCKRERKAVLLTRSAEVWPLSVPALSQLSHRACSPDCLVSHGVVSLCCMTALCMHSPQFLPLESLESLTTTDIDSDDSNERDNANVADGEQIVKDVRSLF